MIRRFFRGGGDPSSDDPYEILRRPAGLASRRVRSLLSAGRRPSMRLVDRAATEKESQARRFFAAVGADAVGRALYSGAGMYVDRSLGATGAYVYATSPRAFRDAEYWLLGPGGSVLPRHEFHEGGYSAVEMHQMVLSGELMLLDEVASDLLAMKWAVAAGEAVQTVVRDPAGLSVHVTPDPGSSTRLVAMGTALRFVDFAGGWALVESCDDGEQLGWTRHSLVDEA